VSRPSPPEGRPVAWEVTADLLARYDRSGPRYTSYPTAVEFHEGVGLEAYQERLEASTSRAPLSIYVHLPFCEERCLFCGCNVIISPDHARALPYLDLLRREMAMLADRLPGPRPLVQLHLGGGTPTYFAPRLLAGFVGELLALFPPTDDAELAVEVDPRVTSNEHVDLLAELGFNRISLGVQDFTPEVQGAIARRQSIEETARLIERARARGYRGVNVDLIYGLPYQRRETFRRTVEEVIELGVDRSAVYSFAHVPAMHPHMKRIPADALPPREEKLALFATARELFLEAGYEPIGMDHFARPDDEIARARREGRLSRNFQGYCVVAADDVVGLGTSAIGDLGDAYFQNAKKLNPYRHAIEQGRLPIERGVVLSADDRLRRDVIRHLMCNFRVDVGLIERRHGIEFRSYFAEDLAQLAEYERDGLVSVGVDAIEATPLGELFIRNLAMCFDRYLRPGASRVEGRPFSRTV